MVSLLGRENILKICLLILTEYSYELDRQPDRRRDGWTDTQHSIARQKYNGQN